MKKVELLAPAGNLENLKWPFYMVRTPFTWAVRNSASELMPRILHWMS